MSIYGRTDRVPLSDVAATAQPRTGDLQAQNDVDWTTRRARGPATGLLRPTAQWAASMPREVVPHALLSKFPRICNLLAVLWQDPGSLRRYLDDLLVDKRGNRQGFPVNILRELFALRAHYDELHPGSSRPWEVMNNNE
jgi:hypothetical protein